MTKSQFIMGWCHDFQYASKVGAEQYTSGPHFKVDLDMEYCCTFASTPSLVDGIEERKRRRQGERERGGE